MSQNQPSRPKSRTRSMIVNAVLIAVAFALLAVAVWSNRAQIREVLDRPFDAPRWLLAFAIYMVGLVLTFVRWHVLVRALDLPFRFRDAVRLGFIGNVFNLVIPGAVGGDVIKGTFLCREHPTRKTHAIASMVIDRALGLLGLFVLAGIGGATIWASSGPDVRRLIVIVWAAVASGVAGLAVLFTPALYRPLLSLARGHGRIETLLNELILMASSYRARLGTVAAMLALATFIHSLFVMVFYIVSRAIFPTGIPSLGEHYVLAPLALFTTAIPLPFGALGLSENISLELFRLAGHRGGAVAMMAFRVVMYAAGLVSIVVYFVNIRQVRELEEAVEAGEAAAEVGPATPLPAASAAD
jgi:uncharacterized membrane protein YbhN (UPF0104 family)